MVESRAEAAVGLTFWAILGSRVRRLDISELMSIKHWMSAAVVGDYRLGTVWCWDINIIISPIPPT